ncbi:hypothetical protein FNV43_RR20725 [Rhamnella rubrinervis]|uniref:Zinc ribbon domain-containing protein n=1 Tax=Rhamnella rubrinervis TaxID=2594499 RepID=A0A8K0E199_9ROSA|nr:hypothetical protein FNV43_RR20725 [Rhamnella rubrinervis]
MFFFFVGGVVQQVPQVLKYDVGRLFFPESYSLPHPQPESLPPSAVSDSLRCRFCDRVFEPEFRFCPFCGLAL